MTVMLDTLCKLSKYLKTSEFLRIFASLIPTIISPITGMPYISRLVPIRPNFSAKLSGMTSDTIAPLIHIVSVYSCGNNVTPS